MRHVSLGNLELSRIGLGTMGMSAYYTGAGSDDAESIRTIHRALDLGVNFVDAAEVYGAPVDGSMRRREAFRSRVHSVSLSIASGVAGTGPRGT